MCPWLQDFYLTSFLFFFYTEIFGSQQPNVITYFFYPTTYIMDSK